MISPSIVTNGRINQKIYEDQKYESFPVLFKRNVVSTISEYLIWNIFF